MIGLVFLIFDFPSLVSYAQKHKLTEAAEDLIDEFDFLNDILNQGWDTLNQLFCARIFDQYIVPQLIYSLDCQTHNVSFRIFNSQNLIRAFNKKKKTNPHPLLQSLAQFPKILQPFSSPTSFVVSRTNLSSIKLPLFCCTQTQNSIFKYSKANHHKLLRVTLQESHKPRAFWNIWI